MTQLNGLDSVDAKLERIHSDVRAQGMSIIALTSELNRLVDRLITVIERKESPRTLQYVILALFALLGATLFGPDALTQALTAVK